MTNLRASVLRAGLISFVVVLVSGCFVQSRRDAEKVLNRHFQMIATNNYDSAMSDYGKQFFDKVSKNEWTKTLKGLTSKLGPYRSHTVVGWRVFKSTGSFGAGTTVSMECQVSYVRYSAIEKFTLFRGLTDSDYKILGHFIESDGLLRE